jgi:hypothetical protein
MTNNDLLKNKENITNFLKALDPRYDFINNK